MKTFLNLTNGLVALPYKNDGFIRIQSTACEQKRWDFILQDLDNNFLMQLAIGESVIVVDGGMKPPRAIWQGLEWVRYALTRLWYDEEIELNKGRIQSSLLYFRERCDMLETRTLKKLEYFKRFATTGRVGLLGIWEKTDRDGDYAYWSNIAREYGGVADDLRDWERIKGLE